jgi:hypothetical protein
MSKAPNHLNIRKKRKPVPPEIAPGETGYQLCNGGGGGSRTYGDAHSYKCLRQFTECLPNTHIFNGSHTANQKPDLELKLIRNLGSN